VWFVQPFGAGSDRAGLWLRLHPALVHLPTLVFGTLLVVAGYVGTLWCYAAMGDAWRMGINRKEKSALVSRGPYRLVRHPIYLFQISMLAGGPATSQPLVLVVIMIH
jgi:protein-S-isoprenylcysteine O-methyltransferase Ste14